MPIPKASRSAMVRGDATGRDMERIERDKATIQRQGAATAATIDRIAAAYERFGKLQDAAKAREHADRLRKSLER